MKTFKLSLVLRTRENTDVFITLDDNIYGIHSQRVNILYVFWRLVISCSLQIYGFRIIITPHVKLICLLFSIQYTRILLEHRWLVYSGWFEPVFESSGSSSESSRKQIFRNILIIFLLCHVCCMFSLELYVEKTLNCAIIDPRWLK